MDEDLPPSETRVLRTLRRSYACLAAWMARNNRNADPSRWPDATRVETASRTEMPPRQPAPPRP